MFRPVNEAEKIYFTIFNSKIPDSTRNHFEKISLEVDERYSSDEIQKYHQLLMNVSDLEALELAARHLQKLPVLTEKFKIMVYIAETIPENYSGFINESSCLLGGYISLISSVFRTVYKVSKGIGLVLVHRV